VENAFSDKGFARFVLSLSCAIFLALAAPPYIDAAENGWEFMIAPYGFLAGLNGDVAVKGVEAEVDADFSDILDILDFAGFLHLEARKNRWGVFLDVAYLDFSADDEVKRRFTSLGAEVKSDLWLVDFGGFYRVAQWSNGTRNSNPNSLDLLAGGRYWKLDTELDLDVSVLGATRRVQWQGDKDWIDPFFGFWLRGDFTEKLLYSVRADIGGFDMGDSSDLTWNLFAALGWRLSAKTSLWLGYRLLDVDYEDGSGSSLFKYDVTLSGPIVGAIFVF
jgi:hypothetical protein